MESKSADGFAHGQDDVNPYILRMFESNLTLDAALMQLRCLSLQVTTVNIIVIDCRKLAHRD